MNPLSGDERTGSEPVTGDALDAIANAVVRHHKEFFGRGPNHTRAFISDNTLVCLLDGVLTPAEEMLVGHGEEDAVTTQREAAQRVMRDDLQALIETHLQRRVRSFMSANDAEQGLMVEVFVLDGPPVGAEGEVTGRDELQELRAKHARDRDE